ncbi:hypothetical protein P9112_011785 [Eukaryota sp. TZLM1-RC]
MRVHFQLNHLHPEENFHCPEPDSVDYWLQNPVNALEVVKLIQQMPTGKAPGPSLLNFDMIKSAVGQCPEIVDDLVLFFNKLLTLKIKVPVELTSARLIALKESQSKIRSIAIGESFSKTLASLVFNRIGKKAKEFFSPFQFGIKTINGASSAALSSDVFFNSSNPIYILSLDFKNVFNSVSRSSILPLLRKHFSEVESFFYSCYGKSSTLIYENFDLLSSSGVKQGDPLGPFIFCLAIHPLMCELKENFPEIDIVTYMDDISVITPITVLKQIATFIQQRYKDIGLSLNISKCLIIGHEPIDFFINDVNVPFINYDQSGFRFLGCYLGNIEEVKSQLSTLLTQFGNELESIENLNIENLFVSSSSLGQPSHISLSVSASKLYCVFAKTMPLADSDSDDDWNAQVKVLPVRLSSSPSLLHSPHPPSYARNSSQKCLNSKNDHCAAKNKKLSKNVSRCSLCHKLGHKRNSKKYENYQKQSISYSVTAAVAELNNLEFNLPPKHECTAEDNDAVVLDSCRKARQTDNCAI